MKKAEAKKQVEKLQKELTKLQEIIDAPEGGRWRAENGRNYFHITFDVKVERTFEGKGNRDNECYAIGNYYKTEAQAQAVVDLLKHIYKFPIPEEGEIEYFLYNCEDSYWSEDTVEKSLFSKVCYHAGNLMHKDTTEQDRAERLKLLKKAYL